MSLHQLISGTIVSQCTNHPVDTFLKLAGSVSILRGLAKNAKVACHKIIDLLWDFKDHYAERKWKHWKKIAGYQNNKKSSLRHRPKSQADKALYWKRE